MGTMTALEFKGYEDLKLIDVPKPEASDGRVLVRMTAAGVTPVRSPRNGECRLLLHRACCQARCTRT